MVLVNLVRDIYTANSLLSLPRHLLGEETCTDLRALTKTTRQEISSRCREQIVTIDISRLKVNSFNITISI